MEIKKLTDDDMTALRRRLGASTTDGSVLQNFEIWWAAHTAKSGFAADPDFLKIAKTWAWSAWRESRATYG